MAAAATGLMWIICLVLAVTGAVSGGFAAFLAALLTGAIATVWLGLASRTGNALRTARVAVIFALCFSVPVVFDPHTMDTFNLPKYTLVAFGGLLLAGLWVVDAVSTRSIRRLRSGLQWPSLAVLAWTAITTITSVDPKVSLLGNYESYDGLYAAAAFICISLVCAEAISLATVSRVLSVFAFAAGGVVVVYGVIQLHDTQTSGPSWDFVRWHATSFAGDIFSTFGNPNHLGGYLAIILPIVLVLGARARRRMHRLFAAVFVLVIVLELLRTAARGAWVAALAALIVLGVALLPELRRHPVLMAGTGVGVLAVVGVGMAAFGRKLLHEPLSALFQSGGHSPVEQRFEIWSVAARLAAHHPLVGTGPDTLALVYPQHQSAAWVAALGPNYLVNGAHDLLMNVLADQGFVGLILLLGLFAVAGLRAVGASRRLLRQERLAESSEATERARAGRMVVGVVAASIAAYIVQALFNVQQIGLSFTFWVLLGLLAVSTRAAGVPNSLSPRRLVESGHGEIAPDALEAPMALRLASAGPKWVTGLVGVAAATLVVLGCIGADGPYRADHAFWAAYAPLSQGAAGTHQIGNSYFTEMQSAMTLNPWEPDYPATEAGSLLAAIGHGGNASVQATVLADARRLYRRATLDEPLNAADQYGLAQVDADFSKLHPAQGALYRSEALAAARKAVSDNPRNAQYTSYLKALTAR